jgi:hypothetical protein
MQVAKKAVFPFLFGPAPVTIHNDGDMAGKPFHVDLLPDTHRIETLVYSGCKSNKN